MEYFLLAVLVLFLLVALSGIKVVPQSHEYVVEQFGKYTTTLRAGLNFIVPVLNRVAHKVEILERQLPFQNDLITKDNVRIEVRVAVFFRIVDSAKSVYRIANIDDAVRTTVVSILRSTGGHMEFDEIQAKREFINDRIKESLAEACGIWGIEVTRTEVLDVAVDEATRSAMQQQLNAERERRATVTKAEGDRQAQQLRADAELYSAQRQAESRRVLAEAEAYATTTVGQAIGQHGRAAVDFEIMKQQIQSIGHLASSPNSKLVIIPSDITRTLGGLSAILETVQGAKS